MIDREPPPPIEAYGVELIGYTDCDDRPPFKLALQVVGDHWFVIAGHLWHRGWSVIDVTDPRAPRPVAFVEGPSDTWTAQVAVADALLVAGLARISPKWGGREGAVHDECAAIFDVSNPLVPRELARFRLGGTGSHRNAWTGGRYAHLAANPAGFRNYVHVVIDLADPARPQEVGRWWLPGQGPGEVVPPGEDGLSLHGPVVTVGNRAYLPYGGGGLAILDVADVTHPRLMSRFRVSPPFRGGFFGAGVHSVLPIPERNLAVMNGEAGPERCDAALDFAGIVDVADEAAPRLVSVLPLPRPAPGLPYRSYCDKGGRFGPHNLHLPQGLPGLETRTDRLYLTWFNAGLRIYDITDARAPEEIAHWVPADPRKRYGPLPETALVAQSEDVLVDTRGYIYLTDKHQGLMILRATV